MTAKFYIVNTTNTFHVPLPNNYKEYSNARYKYSFPVVLFASYKETLNQYPDESLILNVAENMPDKE